MDWKKARLPGTEEAVGLLRGHGQFSVAALTVTGVDDKVRPV